jgi:hypothetical protein
MAGSVSIGISSNAPFQSKPAFEQETPAAPLSYSPLEME